MIHGIPEVNVVGTAKLRARVEELEKENNALTKERDELKAKIKTTWDEAVLNSAKEQIRDIKTLQDVIEDLKYKSHCLEQRNAALVEALKWVRDECRVARQNRSESIDCITVIKCLDFADHTLSSAACDSESAKSEPQNPPSIAGETQTDAEKETERRCATICYLVHEMDIAEKFMTREKMTGNEAREAHYRGELEALRNAMITIVAIGLCTDGKKNSGVGIK